MQVENRNSDVFKRQILEFIEDEVSHLILLLVH